MKPSGHRFVVDAEPPDKNMLPPSEEGSPRTTPPVGRLVAAAFF